MGLEEVLLRETCHLSDKHLLSLVPCAVAGLVPCSDEEMPRGLLKERELFRID